VAAQVVSGVGFLGAGVIMRDGLNVRGINTAATLWCSAAIGCPAGSGLMFDAALASAVVLAANVILRPVAWRIDRGPQAGAEIPVAYRFFAVCRSAGEAHVRALLVQSLAAPAEFELRSVQSQDINGGDRVAVTADLVLVGAGSAHLEQAVSRLSLEPSVSGVRWELVTADDVGGLAATEQATRRRWTARWRR